MEFKTGTIEGVRLSWLGRHLDRRGFLVETFRADELPEGFLPRMSYVSGTEPGTARGPHEHREQTDLFAFIGPGNFEIYLWDNRPGPTQGHRQVLYGGEDRPLALLVPPGVVHAYRNVSRAAVGWVFNYPDRLYAGRGRAEPVDEIRHEERQDLFYQDFVRE